MYMRTFPLSFWDGKKPSQLVFSLPVDQTFNTPITLCVTLL